MSELLYIVMPVYNEEAVIEKVISEWYPMLENGSEDSRMVIADGGSSDSTLSILYDLQKEYPKLVVFSMPGTEHGSKVIALYKYAIENNAEWVFQTDSDGQTVHEEFLEFWNARHSYDAVFGYRKKRGDGFGRKIIEYVLRVLVAMFFGVFVPDANAPFRLMRCTALSKYIDFMSEDFSLPNAVITACFARYKERICFKNISFRARTSGKNHMTLIKILQIGFSSFWNFSKVRKTLKKHEKETSMKG